jgi:hypothetical protein
MSNELIQYRSMLHQNGEIFLFNFKEEFAAFGETDRYFQKFAGIISTERMKNGKTLVGLIPLMIIMQRQYRNAFQNISVFQSYQAWVLVRPAIESALVMGKWLDDLSNFHVWKQHENNWKDYQRIYQGKNLVSQSLPDSSNIQNVLKHINDNFMHTNPSYYRRHSEVVDVDEKNVGMFVTYTDDEQDHRAHLYAFLHLTLFILKSVGQMLSKSYPEHLSFDVNLEKLQNFFCRRVNEIARSNSEHRKLLEELGLWPNWSVPADR